VRTPATASEASAKSLKAEYGKTVYTARMPRFALRKNSEEAWQPISEPVPSRLLRKGRFFLLTPGEMSLHSRRCTARKRAVDFVAIERAACTKLFLSLSISLILSIKSLTCWLFSERFFALSKSWYQVSFHAVIVLLVSYEETLSEQGRIFFLLLSFLSSFPRENSGTHKVPCSSY